MSTRQPLQREPFTPAEAIGQPVPEPREDLPSVTRDEATAQGYRAISGPYSRSEADLLRKAIASLGNVPSVCVRVGRVELELWRSSQGWVSISEKGSSDVGAALAGKGGC